MSVSSQSMGPKVLAEGGYFPYPFFRTSLTTYVEKEYFQMTKIIINLKARLNEVRAEKGATAVEYVLIVGGIAAVIGIAIAAFGNEIQTWFNNILP